jgi:hypothetical protein
MDKHPQNLAPLTLWRHIRKNTIVEAVKPPASVSRFLGSWTYAVTQCMQMILCKTLELLLNKPVKTFS